MKTYKNILVTSLVLEFLCAITFGNATITQLMILLFFIFITSFFLYYYKESYEYFTRYEPSRYECEDRIFKQPESEAEPSKAELKIDIDEAIKFQIWFSETGGIIQNENFETVIRKFTKDGNHT